MSIGRLLRSIVVPIDDAVSEPAESDPFIFLADGCCRFLVGNQSISDASIRHPTKPFLVLCPSGRTTAINRIVRRYRIVSGQVDDASSVPIGPAVVDSDDIGSRAGLSDRVVVDGCRGVWTVVDCRTGWLRLQSFPDDDGHRISVWSSTSIVRLGYAAGWPMSKLDDFRRFRHRSKPVVNRFVDLAILMYLVLVLLNDAYLFYRRIVD